MIPALGAGGPGFNSLLTPFFFFLKFETLFFFVCSYSGERWPVGTPSHGFSPCGFGPTFLQRLHKWPSGLRRQTQVLFLATERRFESCFMQLDLNAGLAQLGERQTEDLEVLSSILRGRIIFFFFLPFLCGSF